MYIFCTVCHIFSNMLWRKKEQERVYLDWAAASPLLPAAKAAMMPWLDTEWGNASAIHQEGQKARDAVEAARSTVAASLQVRPEFITWTASGTESNNIAILGTVLAEAAKGRMFADMEVITTNIEHPSVMQTMKSLERQGVTVRYVPVSEDGVISQVNLQAALSEKTVLVSVSYINSEVGTIQPLHKISKTIKAAEATFNTDILLHVDAAQAPLWVSCQFTATYADLLTLDAGKCCGPKGVGVLVRSRRAHPTSVQYGGGQEDGLRPGTENVAGIVGAAVAIEWAQTGWRARSESVSSVRDAAIDYLGNEIPEVMVNGATSSSGDRVANNINISIPGLDTEFAAVVLDSHGFAVSTKSACSGAGGGVSTVVKEMTNDTARAESTLRITLGPDTEFKQLQNAATVLKQHTQQMSEY